MTRKNILQKNFLVHCVFLYCSWYNTTHKPQLARMACRKHMDQVSEIRSKTDIVALIQTYIPLKKMGRNFKANCPFHGEKTPSFVVSPERQIWHCFGCGKGGDCFTFLMEYDHMEFPEALRILADKAGVKLENHHFDTGLSSKKEKLYALNRLTCEFYQYLLTSHTLGKPALAYVQDKRHVKPQTIKTFQIGFAPHGNALATYLMKKKGYKAEELLDAGLASRRGSLLVDFFQNRLMFPLFDHRDNVIGFSGRVMNDTEKTSKYINTRETLVYHKGDTFFGMPTAKEEMKKQGKVFLMEGEFDVISSFQEGITNAIAVKGTALTVDQVQLLSRFVQKVVLCFDMDKAGQEALRRSLGLLEKKSLSIGVLVLTNGKDPDEAIQQNAGEFRKAIKKDVPVYDFLLSEIAKQFDPHTAEGKRKIGQEILPLLGAVDNEIVKEHYLTKLSELIGVSQDALSKEIIRNQKQEIAKKPLLVAKVQRPRQEVLEEYLLALLLQTNNPKALLAAIVFMTTEYTWMTPAIQKIIEKLTSYVANKENFDAKDFAMSLPTELLSMFDTCFLLPLAATLTEDKYKNETKHVAEELYEIYLRAQIKKVGDAIKQKELGGSLEDVEKLQQQFMSLVQRLSKHDAA